MQQRSGTLYTYEAPVQSRRRLSRIAVESREGAPWEGSFRLFLNCRTECEGHLVVRVGTWEERIPLDAGTQRRVVTIPGRAPQGRDAVRLRFSIERSSLLRPWASESKLKWVFDETWELQAVAPVEDDAVEERLHAAANTGIAPDTEPGLLPARRQPPPVETLLAEWRTRADDAEGETAPSPFEAFMPEEAEDQGTGPDQAAAAAAVANPADAESVPSGGATTSVKNTPPAPSPWVMDELDEAQLEELEAVAEAAVVAEEVGETPLAIEKAGQIEPLEFFAVENDEAAAVGIFDADPPRTDLEASGETLPREQETDPSEPPVSIEAEIEPIEEALAKVLGGSEPSPLVAAEPNSGSAPQEAAEAARLSQSEGLRGELEHLVREGGLVLEQADARLDRIESQVRRELGEMRAEMARLRELLETLRERV